MDTRLRELERRLRGGQVEPASLLRERLRAGQVSPEQLQLAAHLGHAAARQALGEEALPAPPDGPLGPGWVEGLRAWGPTLPLRATRAAVAAALFPFAAARPGDLRPGKAVEAMGLALEALEEERADEGLVHAMFGAAVEADEAARDAGAGEAHWAAMAARLAAEATAAHLAERVHGVYSGLFPSLPRAWGAIDAAVRALGEVPVRAAIAAALLPAALQEPA